jgi:tRNA (guanine37-N1)-methyltransferase
VRELSLGDYVVNGGEVAALAMIEAIARLVPGVIGNADSLCEESHSGGLLEYPAYTRPATWRDLAVPPVLLSGDHARIQRWHRRNQALARTASVRPDLIAALDVANLDVADRELLAAHGFVWAEDGRCNPWLSGRRAPTTRCSAR